ncbi:hypothetical protein ACIKTA_18235, partial [Hansschlegelia beijingensis]
MSSPSVLSPEALVSRVLHRDGLILILDKPAGVPVHAGPKGGPNLEAASRDWFWTISVCAIAYGACG